MKNNSFNKDEKEVKEFIKLMQSLEKEQQAGLLIMINGAGLMSGQKKKAT